MVDLEDNITISKKKIKFTGFSTPGKVGKTSDTPGNFLKFAKILARWPSYTRKVHGVHIFFFRFYFVSAFSPSFCIFYTISIVKFFSLPGEICLNNL